MDFRRKFFRINLPSLPILLVGLMVIAFLPSSHVQAQCANDNIVDATAPPLPCAGDTSFGIGAGTYAEVQVISGINYTFSTCGSPFDSYLTGYNGASASPEFFNDGNGPSCPGTQASVNWTSTFTGTLRVLVDVENGGSCIPCTIPFLDTDTVLNNCPAYGSATLRFRQNTSLLITSPFTPMCSGETRNLAATPASGIFSGTGVSGSVFTAPDSNSGFTITYTAGQCSTTQTIPVNRNPVVNSIVGDSVFCPGGSVALIADALPGSGAISSYQWKRNGNNVGFNTSVFTASQPGDYTVLVTNSNGCSAESAPKAVTEFTPASVSISGDASYCSGSSGLLTANTIGSIVSYVWKLNGGNIGFNTPTHAVNLPGSYTVLITSSDGCSTESAPFPVSENMTPTVAVSKTDITCFGLNDGTATANVTGGTAPYSYLWNTLIAQDTSVADSLAVGAYHVTVTDSNGCLTVSSDVTIAAPSAIVINFGTISSSCLGRTSGSINSFVSGGLQPYSFMWSNAGTTQDISGLAPGGYTLSVTDTNGCVMARSADVPAFPQPSVSFTAADVCDGKQTVFSNASSVSPGILTYSWDFGDGDSSELKNPTHLYGSVGSYSVRLVATSNNGCSDSTTGDVIVNPVPDATISFEKDLICFGDSVLLSATPGAAVYQWNTGEISTEIVADETRNYAVTVTHSNGCTASDFVSITVMDSLVGEAGNDTSISKGFSVPLFASTGFLYQWIPEETLDNPESRTPIATPSATTTYTVTLTDKFDCFVTKNVTVEVISDYKLIIPNLITPNGDGHNDAWVIKNILEYTGCEVYIFNRWGTEIYNSKEYQNDWDGSLEGKTLADGTYYYVVTCQESNVVYKGSVAILR